MERSAYSILKRFAFIGTYQPRQCSIATFTTDLCEFIAEEYKGTARIACPSTIRRRVLEEVIALPDRVGIAELDELKVIAVGQ